MHNDTNEPPFSAATATGSSLAEFKRDHGRAAVVIVTVLAIPPILLGAIGGVLVGLLLALPGLFMAMIVAIPHHLRRVEPAS